MPLAGTPVADEFRGAWCYSTFIGGDEDGIQPEDYDTLIGNLADHNINNLIFYAVNAGMANYPSRHLLWNEGLTGTVGQDPGWDPLATAAQLGHDRGMVVHAKVNAFLGWNATERPSHPDHLLNASPELFHVRRNGEMMTPEGGRQLFLNPAHPEVQQLVTDLCLEMVESHSIDVLHFDYLRYPSTEYSYDPVTLGRFWARFGRSPDDLPQEWAQWRRDQITEMLMRIRAQVRRRRWEVLFGADVWISRSSGIADVLQDMERWRQMHIMDFDVPMLYTQGLPTYRFHLSDHLAHAHGRSVVAGLGIHQMSDNTATMDEQIVEARAQGALGAALFNDRTLFPLGVPGAMAEHLRTGLFSEPASTPAFPWKTRAEFAPPVFGGLLMAEPRSGMAVLRWESASDVSAPINYSVYMSDTAAGQDFLTPIHATQGNRILVEGLENGQAHHFTVRAEDDFGNEEQNLAELTVTPEANHSFPLETFEGRTVFQDPNESPFTRGLDESSTIQIVRSPVHTGDFAGRLRLLWTDEVSGECFLAVEPTQTLCPDFTGWLSLWVHGGGEGEKIAAVLRDEGMERTPFVAVDWTGWRQIEWFLPQVEFVAWNGGDGILEGGVFGGAFAGLLVCPNGNAATTLHLDTVENQVRPDAQAPQFEGLQSLTGDGPSVVLAWNMGMDASNPITHNIYMADSSGTFDFSSPVASTQRLHHTLPMPATTARFVVRAQDALGNEDQNMVALTAGSDVLTLESFEAPSASYWNGNSGSGIAFEDPNYSGSTSGVDPGSAWQIVANPRVEGAQAGQLFVRWTDMSNGLCRVTTHPNRPVIPALDGVFSVWIHGAGDSAQVSLVLVDDLRAGGSSVEYEQTPYLSVDWAGWREVRWSIQNVDWIGWKDGTGGFEDSSAGGHFDGFLLRSGDSEELTLNFDAITVEPQPVAPGQPGLIVR